MAVDLVLFYVIIPVFIALLAMFVAQSYEYHRLAKSWIVTTNPKIYHHNLDDIATENFSDEPLGDHLRRIRVSDCHNLRYMVFNINISYYALNGSVQRKIAKLLLKRYGVKLRWIRVENF